MVRAIQIPSVQAVALFRHELCCNLKEFVRQEDLHLLLNRQARSTLSALPTTPLHLFMRESGLTTAPVAFDTRKQPLAVRLTNACIGSQLKEMYHQPVSCALMCRVDKKDHSRGHEAENLLLAHPDEELVVKTILLSDITLANGEAVR